MLKTMNDKPMNDTIQAIPYLSVVRVEGGDAGDFLQSQLSADIAALEPGESTPACYCTPKGKVLGLLLVGRDGTGYLLAGSNELLPGILQRLKMFVMRSEVTFSDTGAVAVSGPSGPAFACSGQAADMEDPEAWRAGELLAGITWLNAKSTDSFIPQMLGFENIGAVSFQKGCYPGQEIVARARYLGKVKRKPLIATVEGIPAPGTGTKVRVRRGEQWSDAVVVDSARLDENRTVMFTVAPGEPESAAEEVEIEGRTYRCATT
jgi:folate-binding protein YgfZ